MDCKASPPNLLTAEICWWLDKIGVTERVDEEMDELDTAGVADAPAGAAFTDMAVLRKGDRTCADRIRTGELARVGVSVRLSFVTAAGASDDAAGCDMTVPDGPATGMRATGIAGAPEDPPGHGS
mmetsp:Transcript_23304/g.40992  ORF Transcript_23304/g.40992 Transcript_23304/m.40992 type:complete len:125 (+) Transcript_23304:498-872(+)